MSVFGYMHRDSIIHRMPAGSKILVLLMAGTALFWAESIWPVLAFLVLTLIACAATRIPARTFISPLISSLWIFALLFVFQLYANSLATAGIVTLRLLVLLLLSFVLTLTTSVSAMIATFETALGWVAWLGLNPAKISLGIALAIRFVPLIADVTAQVREAQRARGLESNVIAVAMPVLMQTLKMADDIADAIDARSFDA